MSSIAVIVNPISGGGRGKKIWEELKHGLHALFDHINCRISNHVDDIAQLTRNLLSDSPDYLLVVGGDGSLSHAVNGLFENDTLVQPATRFAYFNSGCGGDFARQFPKQKITEFLDRLKHNVTVQSNVGKVTFDDKSVRYFINIASCGLSADVDSNMAKRGWIKKLGGTVNYFLQALKGLMVFKKVPVHIRFDDNLSFDFDIFLIALCNGQYFGGSMHVAPMAKISDDLLDVVVFHDFSKLSAFFKLPKIYSGKHLLEEGVHYVQAKKIYIENKKDKPLFVEADGEIIGQLPAYFELTKQNLSIIV